MQIAVITTPRNPEYVYETIRQIRDGHAPSSVEAFSDDPAYRVDVCPTRHLHPTAQKIRDGFEKGAHRACVNFLGALSSGVGDLLIFEDDVEVKHTWYGVMGRVIKNSGAELVSLYWPEDVHLQEEVRGVDEGAPWRPYAKPEVFHGSLGLWVSGRVRYSLADFIHRRLLDHPHREMEPFDTLVAQFLHAHPQIRVVAPTTAQVNHRGEHSAIAENRDHGLRRCPGW